VTYEGNPARRGNQVMKVLVIITIALVAYWAVNGGLDEITVSDTAATNTVTQSE
jgi:hypothetical protein